jgi:transmembrane sensor
MTDHAAIEREASAWIERRDMGEWCADTQSQFDDWMNRDLANSIAYWRLEAAWNRTERMAALRPIETPRLTRPTIGQAPRNGLKFAAALGLFVIVGAICAGAVYYVSRPTYQTFATTLGGREVLTLRDGSVIELNASTTIRLYDRSGERRVALEKGEAYFNIRHDAAHPFTVTSGNHRITDLGTKFSVRTEKGKLRVALMEGRAEVGNLNSAKPVVLVPGEVAIATADSISVARKPMRELSDALGWRRGQIIFYHTTLADAVAELNRYNRKQLVIADAATARLTINGAFPTNGIDAFTQAAEQVFGVHIADRGDEIVISR